MKIFVKQLAVTALLFSSYACTFAQQVIPPAVPPATGIRPEGAVPPPPPAPGVRPDRLMPQPFGMKEPGAERLTTLTTISGTVTSFATNDRSIYDGFRLKIGTGVTTVRFPEHMGEKLMQALKPGAAVSVNGFADQGPLEQNVFQMISLKAGSREFTDVPPAAPAVPAGAPEQENFSGTISALKLDSSGAARQLVLDRKYTIELPPHVIEQLQPSLKTGKQVRVSGFRMASPAGVVMADKTVVIRPETFTLDGQTYLVR